MIYYSQSVFKCYFVKKIMIMNRLIYEQPLLTYEELKKLIKQRGYDIKSCWEGLGWSVNTVKAASKRNNGYVDKAYMYAVLGWLSYQDEQHHLNNSAVEDNKGETAHLMTTTSSILQIDVPNSIEVVMVRCLKRER